MAKRSWRWGDWRLHQRRHHLWGAMGEGKKEEEGGRKGMVEV